MRYYIAFCVYFAAVASFKLCHASTCSDETTDQDPLFDARLDIATTKISKIMKETCSCPLYSKPADCEEVLRNGYTESGIYTIYPKKPMPGCKSLQVYCDMDTDGGGWMVIQRRGYIMTPEDFFNQDWATYKAGFGDLMKEFWLGNDNIHVLTNQGKYVVRMEMRNTKGEERYAVYETFKIENEKENYKLHIGGYSGTAGDALSPHNDKWFYTKDRANSYPGTPSRQVPTGGWWYNVFPSTNLNALKKTEGQDTIFWDPFGGYITPLVFTEIKLRQKQ